MVDSATLGFLEVLGFGLLISIILILVFSSLRRKVPDVYEHRSLLNTWKSHDDFDGNRVPVVLPRPTNTFFGWIRPIIFVSEDEIVRKLGLDAAMFLRFICTCLKVLCILSLVGTLMLMPAYGTGDATIKERNPDTDQIEERDVEGLRIISLTNVKPGDSRLWATAVMEFVVAVVVMYFMAMDFSKFAELRRAYRKSDNPVNYALVVYDIPKEHRNEAAIRQRFELMVPGQVADVIMVRQCAAAIKLQGKLDVAVMKRELAEYVAETKKVDPEFRPGFCGCMMCHKPKVNALEYWTAEQTKLADEIKELGSSSEICPSAIVLFSNKRAASLLAQANIASTAASWTVERAGEPAGVHWKAFGIDSYQAELRTLIVFVFIILFTGFWTIPATFIAGLFSITKLTQNDAFKWARFLLDISPAVTALIDSVLPAVVMSVLISLIPTLFRFVVGFERISALAVIERKTRDYFYFFTLYGAFFVFVLGSSFLDSLAVIRDNPVEIIRALANGVPGNGIYYATFVLVRTFIPLSMQLSGIIRVVLRAVKLKLAKTERQKRAARSGGSLFQYFRYSGDAMLVMFLSVMFSSLNPIVPICGVMYFLLANTAFRYMLYFTMHQPWDGGGELYRGAFWGTMVGLILKQIVTIVIISLNRGAAQAIVCVIPLLATIGISLSVDRRFMAISAHGSLHDMFEDSAKLDEIPTRYKNIYVQPAGKTEEYENLNGLEEVKDVYPEVQYDEGDNTDGLESEHTDSKVGYVPDRAADRVEV